MPINRPKIVMWALTCTITKTARPKVKAIKTRSPGSSGLMCTQLAHPKKLRIIFPTNSAKRAFQRMLSLAVSSLIPRRSLNVFPAIFSCLVHRELKIIYLERKKNLYYAFFTKILFKMLPS